MRHSVRAFLEDSDFAVFEAENGERGLALFRDLRPDLVLIDLRMPGMDGLAIVGIITQESPETPIIVLSGTGIIEDAIEALRQGAWDFVVKPAGSMVELEHAVNRALERATRMRASHRHQQHLVEEVAQLVAVIEQTSESVVITDTDGIIQYVNPAFERITGYTHAEAVGKTPRILKSGVHDGDFYRNLWQTISRGEVWRGRITNRRRDGSLFDAEATISPLRDDSDSIVSYVSVRRDVTHEAELERQLRQAQKMEAIGTLAGGIAHDFNNILTPIAGYTEMALMDVPENSQTEGYLREVLKAARRAQDLSRQILTFSREREQERQPVRLTSVIREALKLLRASLPATIDIQQQLAAKSDVVLADPTQLHQIMMNLCTNAGHAMRKSGGVLTVSTCNIPGDNLAFEGGQGPDAWIRLTVEDTGHGIPAEMLDKVFNPYFTTKGPTGGTGLGLSVVHGIIQSLGGSIKVRSTINAGSVFTVALPVTELGAPSSEDSRPTLPRGNERLLVVDDEPANVSLYQGMLERLGYCVSAFGSSEAALRAFQDRPDTFDLVLSDVTMPGMTGLALAQQIRSIRSDLPVVLCTGFSEIITPEQIQNSNICSVLTKPVSLRDLGQKIRTVLDQGS